MVAESCMRSQRVVCGFFKIKLLISRTFGAPIACEWASCSLSSATPKSSARRGKPAAQKSCSSSSLSPPRKLAKWKQKQQTVFCNLDNNKKLIGPQVSKLQGWAGCWCAKDRCPQFWSFAGHTNQLRHKGVWEPWQSGSAVLQKWNNHWEVRHKVKCASEQDVIALHYIALRWALMTKAQSGLKSESKVASFPLHWHCLAAQSYWLWYHRG